MRRGVRIVLSSGIAALAVLFISGSSVAQIMFERTYGDSLWDDARCVRQTQDGGYILAGITHSYGAGDADWYFIRTDPKGELLWSRTYGTNGAECTDWCFSVLETGNGNFVASGGMKSFLEYPSFWLLQLDSSGDTVWARNHGLGYGYFCYVRETSGRGHITVTTADTALGSSGTYDLCLVKTDENGQVVWREMYGDTGSEWGDDVVQTADGGYTAVGGVASSDTNGIQGIYLVKTDPSGQMVWSKTYAGPGTDKARSLVQTPDGGYLVAGWTSSFGAGDRDVYLIRTDSLGDSLWTRTYGGPLSDGGLSLDRTSDGAYVVAGWTESYGAGSHDVLLMKVDSTGDVIWMRTYGGKARDLANSVRQTEDGGYILAGETYSYGAGECDVYLIKTNEDGLTGMEDDHSTLSVRRSMSVLFENRPDPFRRSTTISYSLPATAHVTLEVYDITGRLAETLMDQRQEPGVHEIRWDRKQNPSGIYFCRLRTDDLVQTEKMILVD